MAGYAVKPLMWALLNQMGTVNSISKLATKLTVNKTSNNDLWPLISCQLEQLMCHIHCLIAVNVSPVHAETTAEGEEEKQREAIRLKGH